MPSLKSLELLLLEAELGHVELQVRLVEQAQTIFSPNSVGSTRRGSPSPCPCRAQLDAAVLRQAALGDVEVGHDLDARGDRVLQLERRLHHLVEHAVDAVADAELLLVGLDVDVARAAS
jgi:hypothetical protein